MFISIPLMSFLAALFVMMWSTGVWIAVRVNRQEREREDNARLIRQVATVVLGPADSDGMRRGGLTEDSHQFELAVTDAFAEHQRLGEELKGNVTTFSSVVIKKFARIYAYLGWGSDDTILKIDLDPGEAEPELTETGRRRALDMSARKLPPAPPNVFRRPVRASRDEDDRKK